MIRPAANLPGSDCLNPPNPTFPDGGVSGWIDPGPATAITGDPFSTAVNHPSIYDVYGYAGTNIVSYDPQTVGPTCVSFNPINEFSNLDQGITSVTVSLATRFYRTIMSSTFGSLFDPVQQAARNVVGNGLFLPLVGFVVALAGGWLLWRSSRSTVKFTAEKAGLTTLIVAAGVAATLYPLAIGVNVDRALGQTITTASALAVPADPRHTPADALAGALHAAIIYSSWTQATFGSGTVNEAAAREFGPRLFKAAAYTRTEAAAITADPAKAGPLADAKREDYKTVAKEIQDKYPGVYEYVKGDHASTQFGFTLVGVVGALIAAGFLLMALTRFAYGMIIVRLALGAAPAVALVAAFPTMQHLAGTLLNLVWKAILNAVYFGVGTIVFVVAGIGGILSPTTQLPPLLKLVALALLTYALIRGARQFGLLAAKAKDAQSARDVRKGQDRAPSPGEDAPAPVFEPERSFAMDAEARMSTSRPGRELAGIAARTAAVRVVGAATGPVGVAAATATSGITAATRTVPRALTSPAVTRAVSGPKYVPSSAGPMRAVAATRGVYKIHSVTGASR